MRFIKRLYSNDFVIPDFLAQKYIPSLDGLRAFSIILVLIAHFNDEAKNKTLLALVGGATLGVHIFFVISGFLITSLLIKERVDKNSINLKNFYIRRFLRILPVAFLYIIVLILLNYFFNLGIQPKYFLYQVTFTENFNMDMVWQTKHFWTLSIEEQFYLIFPFLMKNNLKLYINVSLTFLVLSVLLALIRHNVPQDHGYIANTYVYMDQFLNQGLFSIIIGSLMAILLCKFPLNVNINSKYVTLIQCTIIPIVWFFFRKPFLGIITYMIAAVLIAIFIVTVIYFRNNGIHRFLNLQPVKTIGVLSYSLYIWQQLFTNKQPWRNFIVNDFSLLINLCMLLFVAYMSYNYFERSFLNLRKKFKA